MARTLAIICAVLFHSAVLLFGGILFPKPKDDFDAQRQVELLSEAEAEPEKPKTEDPAETQDELEAEGEDLPNPEELVRSLQPPSVDDGPALDAVSLSAIEQALSGQGVAGGDLSEVLTFNSGGRLGASGRGGDVLSASFDLDDIDQKPRATYQAAPMYPSQLRSKKLEGVVTLIFVVDETGKVTTPRVEDSTHPAFDKPALEALRQWRFEPALRGGKRVPWKMRVGIRFQPS